jgi:hypothetical protein
VPEARPFVLTLGLLSARFSFNELIGFLTFCFFGDLSPVATSLLFAGSGVRAGYAGCVERSDRSLVMLDADRRCLHRRLTRRGLELRHAGGAGGCGCSRGQGHWRWSCPWDSGTTALARGVAAQHDGVDDEEVTGDEPGGLGA